MKKIKYLEVIIFLIASIIIGINHEPWADEAQSWLIARDSTVSEIVWDISRYEGVFPLWYLILKLFIVCGLKYEYIFIIPIIFSTIGICIFLSSDKVPLSIKILLPFSFYVFYQYTIIARNYCLLFLAFSLLLKTYDNRFEKPNMYILNLIFFSFISMHGMLISGILGVIYFLELVSKKRWKYIYSFIYIIIIWILEIVLLFPRNDLFMNVNVLNGVVPTVKYIFSKLILFDTDYKYLIQNIISLSLFLFIIIKSLIVKENVSFAIVEIVLCMFFLVIRAISHHFGIMFLLVMFGIILNYRSVIKNNNIFSKIINIVLILYCVYSIQSSYNELNYSYCGSKEMAKYIKNNVNYSTKKIYTIDYYTTALLPYFDENIFSERQKSFYEWSTNNQRYYQFNYFDIYKDEICYEMLYKSDYILLDDKITEKKLEIRNIIENSELYELEYQTIGNSFYKNSYSEDQGFILYKRIDNAK